jgi:hypothetical protein
MCRGSIQQRFASAAVVTASRPKTSSGFDHENLQFCLEVCDRVVASLEQGHPVDVACAGAGIGRTTFYRWLERARLPDAPETLQSFLNSVTAAKRLPKKPLAPAKHLSVISKLAAVPRPKKDGVTSGGSAKHPQAFPIVCEAQNLVPPVDYVNYRYLPAPFRSQLLMCIHSLARDFPFDKKLSELADDERCIFQSLVSAIARSPCDLQGPVTFSWYGKPATVMFADFEFARPIIHRLAARYIRDRQRHAHPAPFSSASEPKSEAARGCDEEEHDAMENWHVFDQQFDEDDQFGDSESLAAGLEDPPVCCSSSSSDYQDEYMVSDESLSYVQAATCSLEQQSFSSDALVDFDLSMTDYSDMLVYDEFA